LSAWCSPVFSSSSAWRKGTERIITPTLNPLATAAIILIVAVFVLLQQEDLRDRLIRLFGSRDLHRTTVAMDDAARRISRYFLTQLAINAVFGVIIGTGLFFIGIPSPVLFSPRCCGSCLMSVRLWQASFLSRSARPSILAGPWSSLRQRWLHH
jgi:predicted PurR-regulated permease PerM